MASALRTSRIFTPARLMLGLLVCAAPAWGQPSEASSTSPLGYVLSGWGPNLTANQLIQHWMRRDTDTRSAVPRAEWSAAPLRPLPLDEGALRRIKNGLGVDYRIGHSGGLHFNVYSRRHAKGEGVRFGLRQQTAAVDTQRWALGGSMQQVRTEDGERFIRFVPQFIVNPDGAHGRMRRWRFALEYGYFFGGDKRAAVAERVWQASLSARF